MEHGIYVLNSSLLKQDEKQDFHSPVNHSTEYEACFLISNRLIHSEKLLTPSRDSNLTTVICKKLDRKYP